MVVNALPFDYHDFITQGGHSDFAAFVLLAALPVGLLALALHNFGLTRVLIVALVHQYGPAVNVGPYFQGEFSLQASKV